MSSFYSEEELKNLGLKEYGNNVFISRKASLYETSSISIGNNVRIDDYCIISGKNVIGNNVHIAAGVYCFGGQTGIHMEDYVGVSSRTAIYAESDDYSGEFLTNPTIPDEFKNVICGSVEIKKHALIGTGCTILPNVTIGEGVSVGSMSLINKSLREWCIYVGIPCKLMKNRKKNLLELEKNYLRIKN